MNIDDLDVAPAPGPSDMRGAIVRYRNRQVVLRRRDGHSWEGRCPVCGRDGCLFRPDNYLWHYACGFRDRPDPTPIGQGPEAHGRDHW